VGHLNLPVANTCNARAAEDGNQGMLVSESMWNADVAANPCRTAMNRPKSHHINDENSQNQ